MEINRHDATRLNLALFNAILFNKQQKIVKRGSKYTSLVNLIIDNFYLILIKISSFKKEKYLQSWIRVPEVKKKNEKKK